MFTYYNIVYIVYSSMIYPMSQALLTKNKTEAKTMVLGGYLPTNPPNFVEVITTQVYPEARPCPNWYIRSVRAYPLVEFGQTAPSRAIRGSSISVHSTLPPSYQCGQCRWSFAGFESERRTRLLTSRRAQAYYPKIWGDLAIGFQGGDAGTNCMTRKGIEPLFPRSSFESECNTKGHPFAPTPAEFGKGSGLMEMCCFSEAMNNANKCVDVTVKAWRQLNLA